MKTRNEKLEEFLSSLDSEINIINCVDLDNVTDFNSLREEIEGSKGFDIEISYYSNAIEYLTENDASLTESLAIAAESGYNIENLNSELLASLLASQKNREDFEEFEDKVIDFFDWLDTYSERLDLIEGLEEELDSLESEETTPAIEGHIKHLEFEITHLKNNIAD